MAIKSSGFFHRGKKYLNSSNLHLEVCNFKDIRHQDSCLVGRQVQSKLIQEYFTITNCKCLTTFQLQTEMSKVGSHKEVEEM